jgi:hypothetical protein
MMADPLKMVTGALFGVIPSVMSGLMSDSSSAPTPTKPNVMPTPDDQAVQQAQRRSITAQMARRGRASTILTGNQSPGEKLGG